jgi:hypothetical protein
MQMKSGDSQTSHCKVAGNDQGSHRKQKSEGEVVCQGVVVLRPPEQGVLAMASRQLDYQAKAVNVGDQAGPDNPGLVADAKVHSTVGDRPARQKMCDRIQEYSLIASLRYRRADWPTPPRSADCDGPWSNIFQLARERWQQIQRPTHTAHPNCRTSARDAHTGPAPSLDLIGIRRSNLFANQ